MQSLFRYVAPPSPCGYLPDQSWELEYEYVLTLSAEEYMRRMLEGWRRFGTMLFRPRCPSCTACRALRVLVNEFRPNRSQRRCRKMNEGEVQLRIGPPKLTRAKLELYDRFHAYQSEAKGWPWHAPKDAESYRHSFVDNPFPIEEWCYYLENRLVGVGYVDALSAGLSAIYFVYDPAYRKRALGVWNVLSIIEQAQARGLPHVYLGYYVIGCTDMEYKGNYVPNQVRDPDGAWRDFRK
jgi:arginine-tRNA-protein transferase